MFTGIIESLGTIISFADAGTNRTFRISSTLSGDLKTDQSLSHDGVCLTVEAADGEGYQVTAVAETLAKSRLGDWKAGDQVNLERCLPLNGRLDGHLVQGHVDSTGVCLSREDLGGSWEFRFKFPEEFAALVVEKGSVAVNGVSLTCFAVARDNFRVAVIPYTFDHTNLSSLRPGTRVNLEFDLIGKYVQRMATLK